MQILIIAIVAEAVCVYLIVNVSGLIGHVWQ